MPEHENDHFRDVPKMKKHLPCPSEEEEQVTLFNWAKMQEKKYPELALMFHIPNGGMRSKSEAARLKKQGVEAGVPDICIPCAKCGKHGLFIELKKLTGGRTSKEQKEWIEALNKAGYAATVCCGWKEASKMILAYLEWRLP